MTQLIQVTAGGAPGHAEFAQLRRSARGGIWVEAIGVVALLLVAFALPSLLTDRLLRLEWVVRAVLLATFVAVVLRQLQRRLLTPLRVALSDEEMALAVERSDPAVKQALISSLQFDRELHGSPVPGRAASIESAALKAAVVADVRARMAAIPFRKAIDAARVRRFGFGIAGAVLFFVAWAGLDASSLGTWAARNLALANVDWPRYTALSLAGSEGELRLPQGDALTLRVAVAGPVPDQVFVDYRFADGERGSEALSRTGEREFTWTIDAVLTDMALSLHGGDSLPVEVRVVVVERPRIDDLVVEVTYPVYMERDAEVLPPTEGEVRLPKGAVLAIAGKSQKALDEAFLLFGSEQKIALARGADGQSFAGEFAPTTSGLLVVDVIDRDRLGSGTPPKLLLRVGDDKAPTLEFRPRGIGSSITAMARIPGELRVRDDFGLREVSASFRASAAQAPDKGEEAPPEVPFQPAGVDFGAALERSALRYETTAQVDLLQWNKQQDEQSTSNPIRPGMLFSLRFQAKDNFGPGEPHEGAGETMVFSVVTREKLTEDLRRRQVEQRGELQRVVDEESRALLELSETVNPTQAGDKRRQVEARFKTLARQQVALGRRVRFIGESYQRLLWEYENNRVWTANQVRDFEQRIVEPLLAIAQEAFPATGRLVDAFVGTGAEATRTAAVEGYRDIVRRLTAVLKQMEDAESLAAVIEDLREVIKLENDAIREAEQRRKTREDDIFTPAKPKSPDEKKK